MPQLILVPMFTLNGQAVRNFVITCIINETCHFLGEDGILGMRHFFPDATGNFTSEKVFPDNKNFKMTPWLILST